ncbi:MAG: cytidylyltransferase domain-containing protein, partial [Campylobacterota bacterium]
MIIIPARISSTRFAGKVLAKIGDTPMVIKTAQAVAQIDEVVIATDSKEVIDVAKKYGFDAVMTSSHHKSGTDRINEAATSLGLSDDTIIVNVQADEPFIEKEVVAKVRDLTIANKMDEQVLLNSAYKTVCFDDAQDPNLVKVVINAS